MEAPHGRPSPQIGRCAGQHLSGGPSRATDLPRPPAPAPRAAVSQRCCAPAASRRASSCALRCCSSSESTLTWPSRRCFARRWSRTSGSSSRQLWHRRRTAGHRLCAVTACSTAARSCQACWMPSLRHLRTFSEQPVSSAKAGQASARFALCARRRMDALRHRGVRCRAPKPVTHAAGRVPCCSPATFHTTAFAMPPSAVSTPQRGPAYSLLSDAATIDRCHRPKREAKLQLSVG